jgi:hypothetical protein
MPFLSVIYKSWNLFIFFLIHFMMKIYFNVWDSEAILLLFLTHFDMFRHVFSTCPNMFQLNQVRCKLFFMKYSQAIERKFVFIELGKGSIFHIREIFT